MEKEKKKFKLGKNALILSIFTLLAVLIWIGFELFFTINKTTITKVTKSQISPLNPQINTKLIDSLKTSLSFSESELNTIAVIAAEETEEKEE